LNIVVGQNYSQFIDDESQFEINSLLALVT